MPKYIAAYRLLGTVQSFELTAPDIWQALREAKSRLGVDVGVSVTLDVGCQAGTCECCRGK